MAATVTGILLTGVHASRPASGVSAGTLYSCTTHSLIYQTSDTGSTWATWAALTGTGLADPMTTRGDIIVRNSSNTTARLAVGATANMSLKSDGTDAAWGVVPGTLIGLHQYAVSTTYSTSSTTFADVDATNMAVTFTAPASTNVLVRLTAFGDIGSGGGGAEFMRWGIREASTDVTGAAGSVLRYNIGGACASVAFILSGITVASHTYKWSFKTSNAGAAARILVGIGQNDQPPAVMEVWAAP